MNNKTERAAILVLFGNLLSLFGVIWRRIRSHLTLLVAVWAGCTLAIAIVVSVPVYAEAAGYRILLSELEQATTQEYLPPFSLVYSYGSTSLPNLTWPAYQQIDAFASDPASAGIDLPVLRTVRYAATEQVRMLYPDGGREQLMPARFGFLSDFQNQARLVAGDWPAPYTGDGVVDVLVSESTATKLTILVDDVYDLVGAGRETRGFTLRVRVAGIWQPLNPRTDYWFIPPSALSGTVIVPEESFSAAMTQANMAAIRYTSWYHVLEVGAVRSAEIPRLIQSIRQANLNFDRMMPGAALSRSPIEAMERHRDQVRLLTVTLALFSVPMLGLIGYFLMNVAGMVVQRQQQEIAIMRSRGSSRLEVLGLALGQGILLGLASLFVGVPLGLLAAQLIAWTESFLRFTPLPGPPIRLLPQSWRHGLLVLLLVVPAILIPALRASKRTIISYKQERARATQVPLWNRLFVDFLLLIPAVYGYQQLRNNRLIGVPGVTPSADDPFRNPLLMIAPALMVFSLALLALRLLPRVLRLLARVIAWSSGISALLALRFLARTTQAYSGPILLIALTMSLAAFTSSMARTLDQHSLDRARYRAGADVRLVYAPTLTQGAAGASATPATTITLPETPAYLTVPIDDYLELDGVRAVTRVAQSSGNIRIGSGGRIPGAFLAVDRLTLPRVLEPSWRADYASESMGALMNRLASDPAAVLVSSAFASAQGVGVGDRITMELNDLGETHAIPFVIAGTVDLFPTLFADDGPFVIGNYDYSAEMQGGEYAYEIWIDTAPGANISPISARGYGYGLVVAENDPASLLEADLLRPERQGLFGLLSVGFIAAVLVSIIGFLSHTLRSFQRRLVELGMLRAIGLGARQLMSMLIYEQAIVLGVGTAVGTGLGLLVSRLFVPFLQVRAVEHADIPPFVVRIAWSEIAIVCGVAVALLIAVVGVTLVLSRRLRLFEVVKLGEAV